MGLLRSALRASVDSQQWSPLDQRWYQPLDVSAHGLALSPETLFRCGAVLAAVRFRAQSVAMCPPKLYMRTSTNGRQSRKAVPEHPIQRVLRRPNLNQTGYRWRAINEVWSATWGNSYNLIVPGRAGFAAELRTIHPSAIRALPEPRSDGSLVYEWRQKDGEVRHVGQEEILHFRGFSTDGVSGAPMWQFIRNVVGIALAAQAHETTILQKGSRLAGVLSPTAPLTEIQRKELVESWNRVFGGVNSSGQVGALPHGVDFKPLAANHRESQFLELQDFHVGDILRFLGVPGVVVGWADKTATYASAEAFFEKGGVKHCVLPLLMGMEAEEELALLHEDDDDAAGVFIRHNLDVLLRSSMTERYDAYKSALGGNPWQSVNDVRETEDMDPDEDSRSDEIPRPVNMSTGAPDDASPADASPAPPPRPAPKSPQPDDTSGEAADSSARARQMIRASAERLAGREVLEATKAAKKHAKSQAGWTGWVCEEYSRQPGRILAYLPIVSLIDAEEFAAKERDALLASGVEALGDVRGLTERLVALAGG